MGWYRTHLAPHVIDTMCSPSALGSWRSKCVEGLEGHVVEVGFGGGRNLAYYPSLVTRVTAIEPSPVMRKRAAKQIARNPVAVTWGGLDGQRLELSDASVDHAVVTFSLCTIEDPARALAELRRVVRPGGALRVLEHGLSPLPTVASWQRRLDPLEVIIADGCHLTRDPVALVRESDWQIDAVFQKQAPGPKPWSYFSSIRAR